MLEFFAASTGAVNSKRAIEECIENAFAGTGRTDCQLLVIHSSIAHNFQDILNEAHRLAPNARVVGCTCAGVIGNDGANENMRALGIMAVRTSEPSLDLAIASCDEIRGENSFEVSQRMAAELKAQNPNINMIQVLASGIDIASDRTIEGIESVFGAEVPIFGGTSSDNMRAISSFQFVDQKVLERGAVLVGYADPTLSIEMGVHHGSIPLGLGFEVTKSEGNRVYEIENQPAWAFLMDKLGLPANTHPGRCIPIAGMGELLPENLHDEYDNQHILRVIVKVNYADSSFYMPVDCPTGTRLWLTQRDEDLIFNGMTRMMTKLTERIGSRQPVAVFHTDCAARGRAMFDKILKEEIINRMQYPILKGERVPWLGMYGFGEFTLLGGRNYFHNYTTSIYVLLRA